MRKMAKLRQKLQISQITLTLFARYAIETQPPPSRPPGLSGELSIGLVLKPRYFSHSPGQDVC